MSIEQPGIRFFLLLVAVVGLARLPCFSNAQPNAQGGSEVQCWSGRQLALAIADPAVGTAVLMRDVKLVNDDFAVAQQHPRPPGLIVIKRNITVRGLDGIHPKLLDLNYLLVKIQLVGEMTLGLHNLFLVNYRRGSATQQPGFDVLTAVRDAAGRVPIVEMRDSFILYKNCFPPKVASESLVYVGRPIEVAGNNTYQVPYPSPYTCASADAAEPPPPPPPLSLPQPQLAAAPPDGDPLAPYGCFQHVALFIDVAVYGGDMDENGRPIADSTKYPVRGINTMGMCYDVLPMSCITTYGPLGCLLFTRAPPGKAPSGEQQSPPPAAASKPWRRRGAQPLEVVLGVAIGGGSALLIGATILSFVVRDRRRRRRRQQQQRQQLDEEADAAAGAKRPATRAPPYDDTDGRKGDGCAVLAEKVTSPAAAAAAAAAAGSWAAATGSAPAARPPSPPPRTSAAGGNIVETCRKVPLGGGGGDGEGDGQRLAAAAFVTGQGNASALVPAAAAAAAGDGAVPFLDMGVAVSGVEAAALESWAATLTAAPPPLQPASHDDADPVTPATPLQPGINLNLVLDEQVKLSGVTLGKGAFGRVVEGSYCGQLVAVKIIDHGLLGPHRHQHHLVSAAAAAASVAGNTALGDYCSAVDASGDGTAEAAAVAWDRAESEERGLGPLERGSGDGVSATEAADGCSSSCAAGGSGGGGLAVSDGGTAAAGASCPPLMRNSSSNAGVIGGGDGTAVTAVVAAAAGVRVSSISHVAETKSAGPPPTSSSSTLYIGSCTKAGKAAAPATATAAAAAAAAANELDGLQQQPARKMSYTGVGSIQLPQPPLSPPLSSPPPPPPLSSRLAELESTLKQEVEVLARCQHPNIVRLLAACLKPPRFCLVMELMETSLDRLLYDRQPQSATVLMPLDMVLNIATQVAQGLAYLHPTIVHRDLKPANVLLSRSSQGRLLVKLADFGLSRLRDTVLITRHPEVGTAPYISPEAFDVCNSRITDRVDVYALGIMLWEMVSGCRPWPGHNIVVIAFNVSMYHRRPPLDAVPLGRCPPQLRALIESCWDQVPERRPASAEVAKRLALIRQEEERQAKTGGATTTTRLS